MSVEGPKESLQIRIDSQQTTPVNTSGVEKHEPPTFLKSIGDKIKKGVNNLIFSHHKRVVARSYAKNNKCKAHNGFIVRAKEYIKVKEEIKNKLNENHLDLDSVKKLDSKGLKAFFKLAKDELLKNKAFFNMLSSDVKKAFVEQNKNDVTFLSTFSNVYKDELLENKAFFNMLSSDVKKAFIEQNKNDVTFLSTFLNVYKDELLENKEFFNVLPSDVKKAFVEQNKNDVTFLFTFLNVYKDELNKDSSLCIKTILTFKDVIKGDKVLREQLDKDLNIIREKTMDALKSEDLQDQQVFIDMFKDNDKFISCFLENWKGNLMENPACVNFLPDSIKNFINKYKADDSFFNETNVENFISENKTDDIAMNCLFTLFSDKFKCNINLLEKVVNEMINPDAETLVSLLKKQDKPSLLPDRKEEMYNYLKGNESNKNILAGMQIFLDIGRGYTMNFVGPDGGNVNFLTLCSDKTKILESVKEQAKEFSENDINALIDFINYCPAQGFLSAHSCGMAACIIPFFGDSKPYIDVKYDSSGIKLKVQLKGECKPPPLQLYEKIFTFVPVKNTDNEIVFSYKNSLKEKASDINITRLSQDNTKIETII